MLDHTDLRSSQSHQSQLLGVGLRSFGSNAITEWILLTVFLLIFVARGLLPAWATLNTDFPNYYLAASLYHRISLDRVYEWNWFQRQKDHLEIPTSLVGFVPSPPICVLPVLPLTILSPLSAKRVWIVLNLGFLLVALEFLHRVTDLNRRRTALVSLLCVLPLRANFLFGQYYLLILLLMCAAYYTSGRGQRLSSGLLLSAAASLKLFPALFLLIFVWKRDWRSVTGFLLGIVAFTTLSIALFGSEVHRVFLSEVLPRALRGEMVGPYSSNWSSFTALWHRVFLFEPELNPSPLLNSPLAYSVAQAIASTALLLSFLWAMSPDNTTTRKGLEWAALVVLSLLLSSMPASYHYSVLVFVGVVGVDEFLKTEGKRRAFVLMLLLFITCAPVPTRIGRLLMPRLVCSLALYALLLQTVAAGKGLRFRRRWLAAAVSLCALLTVSQLSYLKNRTEDYSRRLSNRSIGYGASSPATIGDRVIFSEMIDEGYAAMSLQNGRLQRIPLADDVLSVAGDRLGVVGYFEQVSRKSAIVRVPLASSPPAAEYLAEGERPKVSSDGKWLAFVREEPKGTSVWLSQEQPHRTPQLVIHGIPNILDVDVTCAGDVIAAVGNSNDSRLILVRHTSGAIEDLGVNGPARYPAISPDGKRLVFSRRKWGSWQLVVRSWTTGQEQQLTHTQCNATLPSWENEYTVLYATDCGRGFGLNAIAQVSLQD
jgi:Glycosyltransferase family 87/WD40-like Beta Propeller Repeat